MIKLLWSTGDPIYDELGHKQRWSSRVRFTHFSSPRFRASNLCGLTEKVQTMTVTCDHDGRQLAKRVRQVYRKPTPGRLQAHIPHFLVASYNHPRTPNDRFNSDHFGNNSILCSLWLAVSRITSSLTGGPAQCSATDFGLSSLTNPTVLYSYGRLLNVLSQ